jgi:4a-hydroxytetrahydrobiopterin dehydratase
MSDLLNQECKTYAEGSPPLTQAESKKYLSNLDSNWSLSDNKSISREFKFKNYYETIAFVNLAATVAHQQDHHPDMTVSYNTCRIEYSTHSVGGLSKNDFICAAKTDRALKL